MRISIAVLLITGITVSGCGSWQGSRANPSNWFGKSRIAGAASDVAVEEVNALIPAEKEGGLFSRSGDSEEDVSVAVASVVDLKIEKTPTGAIIYATGLAARQGAHDVRLRLNEDTEGSTLAYSFRAVYPESATPVGSETGGATVDVSHALSNSRSSPGARHGSGGERLLIAVLPFRRRTSRRIVSSTSRNVSTPERT